MLCRAQLDRALRLLTLVPLLLAAASCGDDDGSAPVCELALHSPNGGEVWSVDSTYAITWDLAGACDGAVAIELLQADTPCATITDSTANDGSYAWTAAACGADSSGYRVRVSERSGAARDESDAAFTLRTAPCSLALLAPTGGEAWSVGAHAEILWIAAGGCGEAVRLELLQGGTVCRTIAPAAPNIGAFGWTVQRCDELDSDYTLRTTDPTTGAADSSAAAFTIAPGCLILVTSPNGGETLRTGEPFELTWEFTGGCARSVALELVRAGAPCATIASPAANSGSYSWTAAQCDGAATGYRLRVTDLGSDHYDESDAEFAIESDCLLTPTYPAGGETLCFGDKIDLTWDDSAACSDTVRLELLLDGELCATIATGVANVGSHNWEVAGCGNETTGYQVRIVDEESGSAATTPEPFAIEKECRLEIEQPDGGESYCEGELATIVWQASVCCGHQVKVELLRDGLACKTIAPATANSGELAWQPERCAGETDGYQIRITDLASNRADVSQSGFSILPPCDFTIDTPAADAVYCVGDPVQIAWDASACCGAQVKLDLVRNGAVCLTIAESAANTGLFPWTAARCGDFATGYRIRVTDISSWRFSESAGTFRINACR